MYKQKFIPNMFDETFTWSDWNPNFYNLVIVDQFHISKFNKYEILNIIKQKEIKCLEKITCKNKVILIKCPLIFISNNEPDNDMLQYLTIVRADEKGKDGISTKILILQCIHIFIKKFQAGIV